MHDFTMADVLREVELLYLVGGHPGVVGLKEVRRGCRCVCECVLLSAFREMELVKCPALTHARLQPGALQVCTNFPAAVPCCTASVYKFAKWMDMKRTSTSSQSPPKCTRKCAACLCTHARLPLDDASLHLVSLELCKMMHMHANALPAHACTSCTGVRGRRGPAPYYGVVPRRGLV